MAERLKKSLLYTYGVADMFFLLMVDLELFYFAVFLTDYARRRNDSRFGNPGDRLHRFEHRIVVVGEP